MLPSLHSISRFVIDHYATAQIFDPHASPRGERAQRGAARDAGSPG